MSVIAAGALLVCGHVIAAPETIDQEPAVVTGGIPWWTIGFGVVSILILLRSKRFLRLPAIASRRLLAPLPAGMFALALFLAPTVGIGGLSLLKGDSSVIASPADEPATAEPASTHTPVPAVTLEQQVELSMAAYFAQGLVLAALIYLRRPLLLPRPGTGVRRLRRMSALGLGVLAILVAWPLVQLTGIAVGVLLAAVGRAADPIAHDTLRLLAENPTALASLVMIALVVLVAPVLEEILYRGLIQEALRSLPGGPWMAIIVTSLFFASRHVGNSELTAVAALFVLSLAFGWAYERSGRIGTPIVMHALFNLGNVGQLLLLTS